MTNSRLNMNRNSRHKIDDSLDSLLGKMHTTPTASTEENLFGLSVMMPWNLGSRVDLFGAEGQTFTVEAMCKDGARVSSLKATLIDVGLSEKNFELFGGELCGARIDWGCWGCSRG